MGRGRNGPAGASGADDDEELRRVVAEAPDEPIGTTAPSGPVTRKSIMRAQVSYETATRRLESELAEQRATAAELDERKAAIQQQLAEATASIEQQLAEGTASIEQQVAERTAAVEQEAAERGAAIEKEAAEHRAEVAAVAAAAQERIDVRTRELDAIADAQRGEQARLAEADHALQVREARVAERERDCDNGFEERRRQGEDELVAQIEPLRKELDGLRAQREELTSELAQLHARAVAAQSRMRTECQDERVRRLQEATEQADAIVAKANETAEAVLAAGESQTRQRRDDLAARESHVRAQEQAMDGSKVSVKAREDDVSDRERQFEQHVDARAKRLSGHAADTARTLAKERDDLDAELRRAREQLSELRQAARRADAIDPAHVHALEQENQRLRGQQANPADVARLARVTAELAEAQESGQSAAAEAASLKERLRAHRDMQEEMRDNDAALQRARSQRDALHSEVEHLREDLDLLRGAAESKSPDSELVAIDDQAEREIAEGIPRLRQQLPELPELVDETRRAMATTLDPRFYDDDVVRCFVAGLAASQLHIIEGISGTGKTSLPLAFAEAIDAPVAVIEVQAAWRDRLDLVGHYSHLQRRYYATPFARALYRAATAPWQSVPMFIVLDEMNLSHPEQYLADVLSALERPVGEHELELLQSDGAAAKLAEGRRVPLGRNVWFIGTANRDETTKTIADKTYDRAHIMELPGKFESQLDVERPKRHGAMPAAHLRKLFGAAATAREADAAWVAERVFDDRIHELLASRRLGIGSRLRRQIKAFVPVYIASGGPRLLALDHLLATKVVRKLDTVFDLRKENVDQLRETISDVAGVDDVAQGLPATDRELKSQHERAEE